MAEGGDAAVGDEQVLFAVDAVGGIEHATAADAQTHYCSSRASGARLRMAMDITAMRTAMPWDTCCRDYRARTVGDLRVHFHAAVDGARDA